MQTKYLDLQPGIFFTPSLSVTITLVSETHLDEMEEKYSKIVVVLIHQTIGFGVSAAAACGQLVVASAAGNEACAGGGQDDEDVLSSLSEAKLITRSVWLELGLRKRRQRSQPTECS